MKTEDEVEEQLRFAKDQLSDAKDKYGNLNQNETEEQVGAMRLELIQRMKGEIMTLEWVLDQQHEKQIV